MTVIGTYRRGVRRYDSDGLCTGEEYGGMTVMGMYRRGVRRYDRSQGGVSQEGVSGPSGFSWCQHSG
ncbi:unnamed protein product [Staurois parvus]|uniref:MHC class I antigen n=1 Tax=Staurois parvus TaxID=386267 RepID=A0ABN9BC93_9NEOB|nr:unnamed protein product [Staurois parvus]